jgi:alpha,alpha-trehalase
MALVAPAFLLLHPALAFERPEPPQVLFGDLYADVQLEHIFPDSKDFADVTAKSPPPEILTLYHAQKPNSPEGLKHFVVTHFDLPPKPPRQGRCLNRSLSAGTSTRSGRC